MITNFIHRYFEARYNKLYKGFIQKPIEIQRQLLSRLLQQASHTLIGEQYDFSRITTPQQYMEKVPLFEYESLRPYLDKIIVEHRRNVLWNTPVRWFAMSSGTTQDKSKYIPVTRESLYEGHYRCGEQMLAIYHHNNPDARFLLGKTLVLGGSKQINRIGEGIFTGDISAVLIKNLYLWTKMGRTPQSIALIADWEEKLDKLVQYASTHDIRAMMGVPSWLIILLKRIREHTGRELTDLWKNIEVFFHGGVNFTPYEQSYRQLLPSPRMRYWETYNASEGYFGVQFSPESKSMLLMLDAGVYYEFLPVDEWDKANPQALTLDCVQTGVNYALVISTNGGLWRYMIGDTIRFTSLRPYLFEITGRTRHFINAFGEELIIENAERALAQACQLTGAQITEYTAAPLFYSNNLTGAHQWLIEFEKEPDSLAHFTQALDNALKALNSDYEAKRSHDISLQQPEVQSVPKGSFARWMKACNKTGGQNKVPRLSNNRHYIDAFLQFLNR